MPDKNDTDATTAALEATPPEPPVKARPAVGSAADVIRLLEPALERMKKAGASAADLERHKRRALELTGFGAKDLDE